MKDPYGTLGISKTATQDQVKKAYRDLAKKHHPDLNPGNKAAEGRFKELNAAYQVLGTATERSKYDRGETQDQRQEAEQQRHSYYRSQQESGRYARGFGAEEDGADIFAELFRGARGGEDHLYQLEIEFKEAALGAEREMTLPGPSGGKLSIKIPPGTESGVRLCFKGRGGPGANKGPAGDAYVELKVKPLAGFTRVGNNIQTELAISFQEGILGAKIKVPTLDGEVTLEIRPGVSTGTRLGIKGKGAGSGVTRGYQIVTLKVVLPTKVDPALQEAIRFLGDKFRYDPRAKP